MCVPMRLIKWLKSKLGTFDYFWDYIEAAYNHFNDIFWGVAVVGAVYAIPFLIYGLSSQFRQFPSWLNWLAIVMAVLLAGYYVWRPYHIRLIPKIRVAGVHFQDTPVTLGGKVVDHRVFVQLLPECLTESPVYESVGYLQKVEKRVGQDQWEETAIDKNLLLNWGDDKVELHPKSERPLNIFFIQRDTGQIIPNLKRDADIPSQKFDAALMNEPILRFYVQITCSDRINGNFVSIPPVRVCLEVRFVGPNRLRPQLQLIVL